MSDPLGHFLPRHLALGVQEVGDILQHQNASLAILVQLQPGDGRGYVQGPPRAGQLDLRGSHPHPVAAAQEHDQLVGDLFRENRLQRHTGEVMVVVGAEQISRRAICLQDAHLRVQRDHGAGDRLQYRFQFTAPLFERLVGSRELGGGGFRQRAALFQVLRHAIEGAHQFPQLLRRRHRDPVTVVPGSDGIHGVRQSLHRPGHLLGKKERQPAADEEDQRSQQE